MKTKLIRRLLCVLLTLSLLSSGLTAFAANEYEPMPCYNSTLSIAANLSISSSGLASCSGNIRFSDSSASANVVMKLQRYKNSSWSTVATWSANDATSLSKTRYVTGDYYYRVVFSATVYSSGTYVESPSATSSMVYYAS